MIVSVETCLEWLASRSPDRMFRSRLAGLFLVIAFGCYNADLAAQQPPVPSPKLVESLRALITNHRGEVAVAIRNLQNGESFEHRGSEVMPTASLIKFPVMIEAYRQASVGKVCIDQPIKLTESDKVPGSGILTTHFSAGAQLSLRDAIRLMIAHSDNTATNLVLDVIGLSSTTNSMKEMGFPETQIHAKVFKRETSISPERSQKYGLGSTTALDMVELFARLHRGELVNRQACDSMLEHLLFCEDKSKFPAKLSSGVKVAHKTGAVNRSRTDAGLIITQSGAVAICVLTDQNADTRWDDDNAANVLCADIAKATYDHYFSRTSAPTQTPPMTVGATGDLVESLQRTLNSRTQPSVALSVDGDFGSATQAAVKTFQQGVKLEPTGIVDVATWKALGPLLTSDAVEPVPQVVNAEKLIVRKEDDPLGLPAVTCKSWIIADVATGEPLWNDRGNDSLDIASTTKIMTAYLVMKLAEQSPGILDEVIEFSERADKTGGSTSGIHAGERTSVRHLLYGLLLPSGNDASVALAEHFGNRFVFSSSPNNEATGYDNFILEMNRQAKELGMASTSYVNPHGLTAEQHKSTAHDLARLASAALSSSLFRKYIGTRQFGCTVEGRAGYQRNVVWHNTNQLLEIDGYSGVKTGTTDAAGACLVALGKRKDRELLVVVLGSAVSQSRYTDTRNLFAWAWRQLDSK